MRLISLVALLASLLLLATPAGAVTDEDRAAAAERVEVGLRQARAGHFREAIDSFEAALKFYPSPEIMHSLARSHEELGNLAEAHGWFQKALETKADYVYSEDARSRLKAIELGLKATHGRLHVRTTPTQARITLTSGEKTSTAGVCGPVGVRCARSASRSASELNLFFRPVTVSMT